MYLLLADWELQKFVQRIKSCTGKFLIKVVQSENKLKVIGDADVYFTRVFR